LGKVAIKTNWKKGHVIYRGREGKQVWLNYEVRGRGYFGSNSEVPTKTEVGDARVAVRNIGKRV